VIPNGPAVVEIDGGGGDRRCFHFPALPGSRGYTSAPVAQGPASGAGPEHTGISLDEPGHP
jgi:hypothetical protein